MVEELIRKEEIKKEINSKGIIINNFFIRHYTNKIPHSNGEYTEDKVLEIFDYENNTLTEIHIRDNMPSFQAYSHTDDKKYYFYKYVVVERYKVKKIEIEDVGISFEDMNIKLSIVHNSFRIYEIQKNN
jgi:hypothetical protein